jgi:hypothetical protein
MKRYTNRNGRKAMKRELRKRKDTERKGEVKEGCCEIKEGRNGRSKGSREARKDSRRSLLDPFEGAHRRNSEQRGQRSGNWGQRH